MGWKSELHASVFTTNDYVHSLIHKCKLLHFNIRRYHKQNVYVKVLPNRAILNIDAEAWWGYFDVDKGVEMRKTVEKNKQDFTSMGNKTGSKPSKMSKC